MYALSSKSSQRRKFTDQDFPAAYRHPYTCFQEKPLISIAGFLYHNMWRWARQKVQAQPLSGDKGQYRGIRDSEL